MGALLDTSANILDRMTNLDDSSCSVEWLRWVGGEGSRGCLNRAKTAPCDQFKHIIHHVTDKVGFRRCINELPSSARVPQKHNGTRPPTIIIRELSTSKQQSRGGL